MGAARQAQVARVLAWAVVAALVACSDDESMPSDHADSGGIMEGGVDAGGGPSPVGGAGGSDAGGAGLQSIDSRYFGLGCLMGDFASVTSDGSTKCSACTEISCCGELHACGMALNERSGCRSYVDCALDCVEATVGSSWDSVPAGVVEECASGCRNLGGNFVVVAPRWPMIEPLLVEATECVLGAPAVEVADGDAGWETGGWETVAGENDAGGSSGCFAQCTGG